MSNRGRPLEALAAFVLAAALAAPAVADPAEGAVSPAVATAPIDQAVLLAYLAGNENFTLLDARSPDEYETGHIVRAVNVPHDAVEAYADRLPGDESAPIVTYCRSGKRARALQARLLELGYENVRVLGPEQIVWSAEAPMFNCGAGAPGASSAPALLPAPESDAARAPATRDE